MPMASIWPRVTTCLRIFFQEPLTSAKDMHMTLVRMAGEARAGASHSPARENTWSPE